MTYKQLEVLCRNVWVMNSDKIAHKHGTTLIDVYSFTAFTEFTHISSASETVPESRKRSNLPPVPILFAKPSPLQPRKNEMTF